MANSAEERMKALPRIKVEHGQPFVAEVMFQGRPMFEIMVHLYAVTIRKGEPTEIEAALTWPSDMSTTKVCISNEEQTKPNNGTWFEEATEIDNDAFKKLKPRKRKK